MKSEAVEITIRLFNLALVVQAVIVFEYEEETKKITDRFIKSYTVSDDFYKVFNLTPDEKHFIEAQILKEFDRC